MSQFAELLKSLQDAATEQNTGSATDDKTIAAAAADSGVTPNENPEDADDDESAGDGDVDDKVVAKSLTATGADGEELEVVDATEILKSLQVGQAEIGEALVKTLTTVTGLVKSQGETIKSLRAEVSAIAGQGRGRKTVVTVAEKPDAGTLAKSSAASETKITPQEVMAKCLAAQKAGALTSLDVARAEIGINNGVGVPADILSRLK